jgi:hypothetical protein
MENAFEGHGALFSFWKDYDPRLGWGGEMIETMESEINEKHPAS